MEKPVRIDKIEVNDSGSTYFSFSNSGNTIFTATPSFVKNMYIHFYLGKDCLTINALHSFVKKENFIYSRPMRDSLFDCYFDIRILEEALILEKLLK